MSLSVGYNCQPATLAMAYNYKPRQASLLVWHGPAGCHRPYQTAHGRSWPLLFYQPQPCLAFAHELPPSERRPTSQHTQQHPHPPLQLSASAPIPAAPLLFTTAICIQASGGGAVSSSSITSHSSVYGTILCVQAFHEVMLGLQP